MRRAPEPPATLIDEAVFATGRVAAGVWRCPLAYPDFRDTGPIEGQIVVFPRTSVWIEPSGGRRFVADAGVATVYNRGQLYRRFPIHPEGDLGDWWRVAPPLALEIAAAIDPRAVERPEQPFGVSWAPVNAALYLRQRQLFRRLRSGAVDPLEAEEEIVALVADVLGAGPPRATARAADLELAAAARERVARDPATGESLADLASALGASPYRLCRAFRAATGTTLHAHRLELRLRAALERIDEPDLARIAVDLGFAHHSHFTAAFRRRFGCTPSQLRAA